MFAAVYRESLEGALRRDGPSAVLADLQATLTRLAAELTADAARDVLSLVSTLGVVAAMVSHPRHEALHHGLNASLAADSADCVYCGRATMVHADDGCATCARPAA